MVGQRLRWTTPARRWVAGWAVFVAALAPSVLVLGPAPARAYTSVTYVCPGATSSDEPLEEYARLQLDAGFVVTFADRTPEDTEDEATVDEMLLGAELVLRAQLAFGLSLGARLALGGQLRDGGGRAAAGGVDDAFADEALGAILQPFVGWHWGQAVARHTSGRVDSSLGCSASTVHHVFETHTVGVEPFVWLSGDRTYAGGHAVWEYRSSARGVEGIGTEAADTDFRLALRFGHVSGFGVGGGLSVGYSFRFLYADLAFHGYGDDRFTWIASCSIGLELLPW